VTFESVLKELPLIAILRGIRPEEAAGVGVALVDAGWRLIEVPLNSPEPLESIRRMVAACPAALVGAGTVMSAEAVRAVHDAGGRFVVAPNFDAAVVHAARALGLDALPGVMSATEAFAALQAGATALKLFPAEMIPPQAVKALRAVLDPGVIVLPVGGISLTNMAPYRAAGATGFGVGSALYQPGMSADEVGRNAARWKAAVELDPSRNQRSASR